MNKIKHFIYWLFIAKPSGLQPTPPDARDFQTGIFGWFGYTPKHTRHIIKTLSVKDQGDFNTCQWNSAITAKEIDEKCVLSVRAMVAKAKRMGLITGNGFSNIRSGKLVFKDWGALEEGTINEGKGLNWEGYSNVNPDSYSERASKHKISSFWFVSSRNDLLKLLDEYKAIQTGIMWYTGFNQGGGFSAPWIISKIEGFKVGGHAITIIGYDMNYQGRKVYVIQNSYGKNWGDDSKFYIDMNYLDNNNYGYFVDLDEIDKEQGRFINDYDGRNVKGSGATIYFVQAGKLKPYPDEITYLAYNPADGQIKNWTKIDDQILKKVKIGDKMDLKKSIYWDYLRNIDNKQRMAKLVDVLSGEGYTGLPEVTE